MFKAITAAVAAAVLTFAGTQAVGSDKHPIKDAAASVRDTKFDAITSFDAVFVSPGIVVGFNEWAGEYAVYAKPRTDLEAIFGTPPIMDKSLHAIQKAARDTGVSIKHVVCKDYVDAPKVKGVDDYSKATAYVTSCEFIPTSVEAAFERLTGYAEGDYAKTVKRVRAEREAAAKTNAKEGS